MITNIIFRRSDSPITSDKPHYENVPFEIPDNWVWTTLGEIFTLQAGKNITAKDIYTEKSEEFKYPCFGGNGIRGYVAISNKIGEYPIIGRQGALCGNINLAHGIFYATEHAVVVERYCDTDLMWGYYTLIALNLNQYATATAQPGLAVNVINDVAIPLPPLHEQQRISKSIKILFSFLDAIECKKLYLKTAISQTKTKVLDLAIHGRLVPQDPTDEPATELLKRINPKAEITSDNGHYQKLPEGWCKCSFDDIFNITMGQSPNGCSINHQQGIEFHQGKILFGEKYLKRSDMFTDAPTKLATPNSLLLCVRAPVGVVNITQREICIGRGLCSLKPNAAINLDYAYHALTTYQSDFDSKSTGSTFKAISGSIIRNEVFALPPLQEQYRIVTKIEEIFAQLDAIEASL